MCHLIFIFNDIRYIKGCRSARLAQKWVEEMNMEHKVLYNTDIVWRLHDGKRWCHGSFEAYKQIMGLDEPAKWTGMIH